MKLLCCWLALVGLMTTGFGAAAHAGALSALAGKPDLTPESFLRSFAGFTFELSAQPQEAETFLRRKRGDCDDFASLASRLLTEHGYKTKLVAVMMEQQTHVVCYVEEAQGFLDFNHRSDAQPIIKSDGSLADIAQKVAGDFRSRWLTASEFSYQHKLPVYVKTVFPSAMTAPVAKQNRQETNEVASGLAGFVSSNRLR